MASRLPGSINRRSPAKSKDFRVRCRINLRRVLSPNSPIPVLATRARVTALGSAPGGAAPFGATRDRLILQPALRELLAEENARRVPSQGPTSTDASSFTVRLAGTSCRLSGTHHAEPAANLRPVAIADRPLTARATRDVAPQRRDSASASRRSGDASAGRAYGPYDGLPSSASRSSPCHRRARWPTLHRWVLDVRHNPSSPLRTMVDSQKGGVMVDRIDNLAAHLDPAAERHAGPPDRLGGVARAM